jgi:hypothetical protein
MTAKLSCGHLVRLRGLLENALGESEQAELVAHLDTCPECQRSLESLAAARPWWDELHWLAGQAAATRLAGDSETVSAASGQVPEPLDFLDSSDHPRALGRLGIHEVVAVIGRG